MKCTKWFFLAGTLMVYPASANELDGLLKQASGMAPAPAATAAELQLFETNVKAALTGAGASADWKALGMGLLTEKQFTILQELPANKQGRGFFAINNQASKNWLLQAPHADSDLYTGKIASRLFLEGGFKAAQWNTVKRNISDMAHTDGTYWQSFTRAFVQHYPDSKVIQLHGFEQSARKTKAGEASGMILSAGHASPPAWVQQTCACLQNAFPGQVNLYQFGVKELGGTTNVQGRLLRSLGNDGFLHIEMSKDMRQQLLNDAAIRKSFSNCL